MKIAKLSNGRVVQLLKPAQRVQFSSRLHVLVANQLTDNPRKIEPHWMPETSVVWVIDFTAAERCVAE